MDWECEFLYNLWKVDDPWKSYVDLEKSLKNGPCNFLYKPSNVALYPKDSWPLAVWNIGMF